EKHAAFGDFLGIDRKRADVAERRNWRTDAFRDELFEGIELDAAPGVWRCQTGVWRAILNQSGAALGVADIILEVLNLVVESRVIEDLRVDPIMRVEGTIERQAATRPGAEDPDHLVGQTEGVARHATAPAF